MKFFLPATAVFFLVLFLCFRPEPQVTVVRSIEDAKPAFDRNNISVVFGCDDNFALCLGVALQSLIDNSDKNNNYDVWILDGGISVGRKARILEMVKERKNFSVRFFDINPFIKLDRKNFPLVSSKTISIATYYRIFIPEIFSAYKRMVYLDCDIIVNTDISKLHNIDLQGKSLGACSFWEASFGVDLPRENSNPEEKAALLVRARRFIEAIDSRDKLYVWAKYYLHRIERDIKKRWQDHVLAGMLVLDMEKLNREEFVGRCLRLLSDPKNRKKLQSEDQDVLNIICDGRVHIIDRKWNMLWYYPKVRERAKALILHYGRCVWGRPWHDTGSSELWWKYAARSPFYYDIITENLGSILSRGIIRMRGATKNYPCFEQPNSLRQKGRFPARK
ncbi:MAG: glycosyltransferase family 8 protein [Holosporaceae bacterium]|nr:glycosyltransferase family 8 protein [Holosporaceae bacterium]